MPILCLILRVPRETFAPFPFARAALQVELFKNLLAIAAQFPGELAKLNLYMQKSLLRGGTEEEGVDRINRINKIYEGTNFPAFLIL